MKTETQCDKPAPRALEKPVLSLIGICSLIFVPFCFLFVAAMLFSIFGPANEKFKVELYYSVPFAALFTVLGCMLAVAGWRLIKSKDTQKEDLITTFYPWVQRVGWLFAGSFALNGILKFTQGHFGDGANNIMFSIILLIFTSRRLKTKRNYDENKNCQQGNQGDGE